MHNFSRVALTATALLGVFLPGAVLGADNASIDVKPYPFTVIVGMVCPTVDDLKKALDGISANGDPGDTICIVLDGSQAVQATATPVEHYTAPGIDGVLTKYSAPGLPDVYGIIQLLPKPASADPPKNTSGVNA